MLENNRFINLAVKPCKTCRFCGSQVWDLLAVWPARRRFGKLCSQGTCQRWRSKFEGLEMVESSCTKEVAPEWIHPIATKTCMPLPGKWHRGADLTLASWTHDNPSTAAYRNATVVLCFWLWDCGMLVTCFQLFKSTGPQPIFVWIPCVSTWPWVMILVVYPWGLTCSWACITSFQKMLELGSTFL